MPLISLQTNLKSLKYGKDVRGGGASNQPYIKSKIPDGFAPQSPDFLLRNGYLNPVNTVSDLLRLGKFYTDLRSPNGLLFTAKQNVLSRTGVRTQASKGPLNEGVYTPLSTLAQAGIVSIGGHVSKQGLNFLDPNTYLDNVTYYQPNADNRLVRLYDKKIQLTGIDLNPVNVTQYQGGPGSVLGIGKTNIRFADQRTGLASGKGPNYLAGLSNSYTQRSGLFNYTLFKFDNNDASPFVVNNLNIDKVIPSGSIKTYQALGYPEINGASFNQLDYFSLVGASFQYARLTGNGVDNAINNDGQHTITPNLYISGSLNVDPNKTGSSTWTAPDTSADYKPALGLSSRDGLPTAVNEFNNNVSSGSITRTETNGRTQDNWISPLGASKKKSFISNNLSNDGYTTNPGFSTNPETQQKDPNINTTDYVSFTSKQIESSTASKGYNIVPAFEDFRNTLRQSSISAKQKELLTVTPANSQNNRNSVAWVSYSDPGARGKDLTSYTTGVANRLGRSIDDINGAESGKFNDLIPFRFTTINNENGNDDYSLQFRAYLDSFNDQVGAQWNSTKYAGRGEEFYTYTGFNRKISLSWSVYAQSRAELMPMYRRLAKLASQLLPDYGTNGYMKGNLVRLTVGGYLYDQIGILEGLTFDVPQESPWEIGINDQGTRATDIAQLPFYIKVTGASFIPLHRKLPKKGQINNLIAMTNEWGEFNNFKGDVSTFAPENSAVDLPNL